MSQGLMCGSRKYPYPPHGWSLEILRGRGVSKANILKGKYEAKLEFLEGRGFKVKTICGGGMVICWNHTMTSIVAVLFRHSHCTHSLNHTLCCYSSYTQLHIQFSPPTNRCATLTWTLSHGLH